VDGRSERVGRGWGERVPSTGLVYAPQATGYVERGGWIYFVVDNDDWRTGKHRLGREAPL
jgi:hypothetical protein